MILIDSSVWFDYFQGRDTPEAERLDALIGTEELATGDLMLAEVLQGFAGDDDFEQARKLLANLQLIVIGGIDIGVQAARHYRALRAKGVTVRKTIDTIIATRCIADGYALLFSDRDFVPFVRHLGLRSAMQG